MTSAHQQHRDDVTPRIPRHRSQHQRICMVSEDFLPAATGVGIHVQRVAEALARRGHHLCLVTTRRPGQPRFEIWRGVRVHRVFSVKLFGFYQALASRRSLRAILEAERVELVHYHYIGLLLLQVLAACRGLDVKRIYTHHMTVGHLTQPLPMRPLRPLLAWLHTRLCRRFDFIMAPARGLVAQLRADGVQTPARYLTNPVEFEVTAALRPVAEPGSFNVLYAGRLNLEKNVPYLVRAFARLARANPAARLWIAGQGDQRPRLERMVRELGLEAQVRFLGHLEHGELASYFAGCDVFVLPSLLETQGMVAMEAMHFAKPVIVTRAIVSARELVDHGRNGFIVDPASVEDLARRLQQLAASPTLRHNMGLLGQQRAEGYGLDAVVDRIEGYYAQLRAGQPIDSRAPSAEIVALKQAAGA